jgi:hypothetical protein
MTRKRRPFDTGDHICSLTEFHVVDILCYFLPQKIMQYTAIASSKWFQKTSGFKKQIEPDHYHKQLWG